MLGGWLLEPRRPAYEQSMRITTSLCFAAAIAAACFACADDDDAKNGASPDQTPDVTASFKARALGRYETPILPAPGGTNGFVRSRVTFNDIVEYVEIEAYLDEGGTMPLFRYQSLGPYVVVGMTDGATNTWDVDLQNTASLLTLLSEPPPGILEALGIDSCPLEIGVPYDVSDGCAAALFAVTDCVDMDIVQASAQGVAFGQPGTDRCVERPTTVGDRLPRVDEAFDPSMPVGFQILRDAMVADDYGQLDAILALFEAERMHRQDLPARALHGVAHFWKLAQFDRAVAAGADPAQAQFHASEQIRLMLEAAEAPNYDPRLDSWLGGTLALVAQSTGDAALSAQATQWLDRGLTSYLEFNAFTVGLLRLGIPPNAPGFGAASEPFLDILDACTNGAIDLAAPDYEPFDNAETRGQQAEACHNGPYAPHNLQGFMLFAGDAALLDGRPELARTLYTNATTVNGWDGWRFQGKIEERLAADLQGWSDRLRDDDPMNNPNAVNDNGACSFCHAR